MNDKELMIGLATKDLDRIRWSFAPPIVVPNKPITEEYRRNYDNVKWQYHWLISEGT